jgi:hypothetical protein
LIPELLVEALLAAHSGSPSTFAIVVGRVPSGWPIELIPPAPVTVLGGTLAGPIKVAVFQYPADAPEPLEDYRSLLLAHGFAHPKRHFGDGFKNAFHAMLCRDSTLAQVNKRAVDGRDPTLLVSLAPDNGFCSDEPRNRRARGVAGDIEIPLLDIPRGVKGTSGGGSSSGGSSDGRAETSRHIGLTTSLPCTELLAWYSAQLANAEGWSMGAVTVASPDVAMQWAEAKDSRGRVWRGQLTVFANGPSREVYLYMTHAPL